MSFQPNPGDELIINGTAYVVGRHPAAPGLAYAQAGRQGIVYQLNAKNGAPHEAKALKVFFPKFRIPAMVYQSEHMEAYGDIPGLQVCKRDVLTPERNGSLIAEQPDLLYAVLMPWVHGMTWFDCLTDQRQLEASDSLALARALAGIGSAMEQKGLAHCDLSAPNVMLPFFLKWNCLKARQLWNWWTWNKCIVLKWIVQMLYWQVRQGMPPIVPSTAGYGVRMQTVLQGQLL